MRSLFLISLLGIFCRGSIVFAAGEFATKAGMVPDEIESVGGHALGLGNAGSAAVSEQSSVRMNPAMLVFEKQYTLSAGYHWPTVGREFYQAGVVDSKTSEVAAGISYTARLTKDKKKEGELSEEDLLSAALDSSVKKRMIIGVAHGFSQLALGIGAQFFEFDDGLGKGSRSASALSFGVAGLVTKTLRFGLSAENFNKKKSEYTVAAPPQLRGGLAWSFFDGDLTTHLDLRDRARVLQENPYYIADGRVHFVDENRPHERMATVSFSARVQNLLRVMGAYGRAFGSGDDRETASFGLALVNNGVVLSYMASVPYLGRGSSHEAVHMSMALAI